MKNVKIIDTPKSKRDHKKNPTPANLKEQLEELKRKQQHKQESDK